jgi:hypothetical protein
MKHEWKKNEKQFYLPKNQPEFISIPKFKFFTIEGKGNPNNDFFAEYVGVLYSLSYAVKMSPKKGNKPNGYVDYTVYPLEGIWDLNDEAKISFDGSFNKNYLVFKLIIRKPDFVEYDFAMHIIDEVKKKKPHDVSGHVKFEEIIDGDSIQMLHLGSYDNEPESFKIMETFAEQENYRRIGKNHREIYLSDIRKVSPEKLKTVLRFSIVKTEK